MKIVRPVSQSDIHLLKSQVDVMVALGGLENRSILIAPSPSVAERAAEITEPLRGICRSFVCQKIEREPEGGWPLAPNIHFGRTVQLLKDLQNDEPWLNMEMDAWPLRPAWSDDVLTEYNLKKKPHMGHLRKTSEVMPGEEGRHMVGGCAVYHPNFHASTTMWQYPQPKVPYDVFMRWAIVGNDKVQHAHDTNLIQHLRRTERYEQDGDVILCHDCPPEPGVSNGNGKVYSVSPEAVLVHGGRDSSLANIVLRSLGIVVEADPQAQAASIATAKEDEKKINDEALFAKVRGVLNGDKMTLKALSDALAMDKKELRAALESPSSPFVVRPPILWVSMREQAQK